MGVPSLPSASLYSALIGRATSPATRTRMGLRNARGIQPLWADARMSSTLRDGGRSFSKKRVHMWLKTCARPVKHCLIFFVKLMYAHMFSRHVLLHIDCTRERDFVRHSGHPAFGGKQLRKGT